MADVVAAGAEAAEAGAVAGAGAAPATAELKSPLATATVEAGASDTPPADGAKPEAAATEAKPEAAAAETPEAKAEREAADAAAKETAKADLLKTYDGLKLPEGIDAGQPVMTELKDWAAGRGLDAEGLQGLTDVFAPKIAEMVNAPYKAWADQVEAWVGEVKAHPEIGGPKMQQNLGMAARAIDAVMGEQAQSFRQMLDTTGAGYNPQMALFLVRLGKQTAEGKPVIGGKPAKQPSAADYYPSMQSKTA